MNKISTAYIELTSQCNLKCKHCYHGENDMDYILDYSILSQLLEDLYKIGCRNISLSGGETLLYKDIDKVVLNFEKMFQIVIITNGILCDTAKFIEYDRSKVLYQVSIDGSSPEENDKIRGKGTFDKAIETISKLRDLGFKVNVNTTISNNNLKNISSFLSVIKEIGVNFVSFQKLNYIGKAQLNKEHLFCSDDELRFIKKEVEYWSDKYSIESMVVTEGYGKCPILSDSSLNIKVSFTGNVFLCQYFEDIESYSIGNIYIDRIYEMLASEKMEDLLSLMELSQKHIRDCFKCKYQMLCMKPCPADILRSGIVEYNDNKCLDIINYIRSIPAIRKPRQ